MENVTPNLRFPDFNTSWKVEELDSITQKITVGIATEVRPFVTSSKQVPLLRNQNIKVGHFDDSSLEYITHEFDEQNKTKRVKNGDVIIVRTGSNMGNACVVPPTYENSQTFTTLIVRPKTIVIDPYFLCFHINSFGISEVERLSAGGGKPNLNAGFLKKYRIKLCSLNEQQKIASFLTTVDEKIQLLKKQQAHLELYKKGVMQKIFSRELRFKDENGKDFPEWELKKLGDIGNTFNGLTGKTKEDFGNGLPYIQYKQIFDNSSIDVSKCDLVQINDSEKQQRVQFGDAFFTVSSETPNEIGTASVLLEKVDEIYLNSFCFGFRPKSLSVTSPYFLRYLFRSPLFRKQIVKLAQGSTRYNMSKIELLKLSVLLPSNLEQEKIASFLTALDEKIDHCKEQIRLTEEWKKGLLQQMFI